MEGPIIYKECVYKIFIIKTIFLKRIHRRCFFFFEMEIMFHNKNE